MNMRLINLKSFVLIFISLLISMSCNLAPGSYPYAEEYKFDTNEQNLIRAIRGFKETNPEFQIPESTQLKDGRKANDFWFHVYFYYSNENEIVKCWTRAIDKNHTTFAFVGINKGLKLGNWKMINQDYTRSENKMQKKKFEERILNKIKDRLK